ncbi:diguanylate cyclase/phosphodiesterase [Sulfuriferula multivorans]|uniref:Sensor protein FixL n=1 Tax=Sulfuriferula multivorans TaxID=1559896 RepID=A0A401JAW9_9PROT|nr:EAL domain-containing protein [Sulfuriferula multivorans]GBL44793.1 diguanylate cyclase/phosphodiesterase [Sulfuriferula multivorans]
MSQQKIDQQRIGLVAGTILVAVAILVGMMVFYIMQRHAENLLRQTLQTSLQNHVDIAQSEIRGGFEKGLTVATRPLLINQIEYANTHSGDNATLTVLTKAAQSFLSTGLTAISLFDAQGKEVAHAGAFLRKPALSVPVSTVGHTQILYSNQFFLRTDVNMVKAGRVVGRVITETPLPTLSSMFKSVERSGKTAELALCASTGANQMQCFPTTLTHHIFTLAKRSPTGAPLPMTHALEGETGFVIAQDYRHQEVVAAYSPVDDLGLGMVLKMDSAELYAPIWSQLRYLLPLIVAMLAIALLLLRWLLTPLVTELVRSEREARAANVRLRDSENRVRMLLDNVDEGIVSISSNGRIELFNPGAERMFNYRSADILGENISILMPEPYRSEHDQYLERYLQTGESHVIGTAREVAAQRSNGETFPMELRVSEFSLDGQRMFIGIMRDITERKATEEKIIHLAHFDALTDLPNRRLVQDRTQQTIAWARRADAQFAVMFIDLDKFKSINDTLGHNVGDQLLQRVAQRLIESLRAEDTVGRQGGDEFIVLLASLSAAEDSAVVAQKILSALSAPFVINGQDLRTGASIGIAVYPQDGEDVETLLKNSDTAMYHAKEAGRSNYQFFAQTMNAAAAERLLLESSLRQAIDRNQLLLHYQPLVNIADGRIVATEALVRWNHPELGLISPARFIPIAEDSGVIIPLGDWVLRRACYQLKQWREQGIPLQRMVVNLSPRQFRQKHLVQTFTQVLKETGVDPHWLGLEVTESVIMENPEEAIGILCELKALGIELSLDDFGTGYSSLSYLKRFPIDKLKIDQSFVRDITTDPDDEGMVAAIIVMAHQLSIRVVAEGVETEAQLAFLRGQGCDEYQGYYFSRPLPADELDTTSVAAC